MEQRRDARAARDGFLPYLKITKTFTRRRGDDLVVATTRAAKRYLRLLRSPDVMREGPLHTFQRREDAEDATAALVEALQDVDFIDDKTWWAPSPWHAAAWLMNETAGSAIGEETFPAPLRMRPHRRRGALLFRGQRSIAWPIIARIARTPRPDEEIAAMRRLAFALDEGYREAEAPPTTTEAHFAVAQHYGIATHLVDLTVDPRVAVFFACDGANDRDLVTVEWVDFSDADDLGLRLILAPPWVQRIYDQRGIFIDTTRVAGELTSHFRRIVFPADARFVRSEFGSRQTIYGESSWFDRAVGWARESSAAAEPGNGPDLWRLLCAAAGDPGFAIESVAPDRLLKQIDLLVDLANWMAMRKSESKVSIDCHALLRLVRDNRPFFTSLFHATGVLAKLWKDEDEIRATHFSVYVAAMIDCYQRMETT